MSILTALANAACIAATWDFLYRGHLLHQSHNLSFSRLGHLDASTARIVIRAPFDSPTPVQMALAGTSQQHVSLVSAETDFTATFLLDGLTPNTTYTYLTNASHTGTFTTPEEHPKRWSLASTSCIKPFYPYNPADHALRIRGLEHLARFHVDMVLFLGDFIYIDLPTSIGQTAGHYVSAYRQVYASPSWTDSLRSIPWLHMYDDHEIENDWDARESGLYRDAIRPYHDYQGGANPPSTMGAGETYYTFHRGGVSFFVLDNRRYRSPIGAPGAKTMLGGKQLADLNHWLDTEARWKVVVSGVPFTRNWRGPDSGDSWAGYLEERDVLLDRMKRTDGVIIISGVGTTCAPALTYTVMSNKAGGGPLENSELTADFRTGMSTRQHCSPQSTVARKMSLSSRHRR